MKFKSFEVYVSFGDYNSSTVAIEERADKKVNEWLRANPNVRVEHFSQSLAELNASIVYQIGVIYSDN